MLNLVHIILKTPENPCAVLCFHPIGCPSFRGGCPSPISRFRYRAESRIKGSRIVLRTNRFGFRFCAERSRSFPAHGGSARRCRGLVRWRRWTDPDLVHLSSFPPSWFTCRKNSRAENCVSLSIPKPCLYRVNLLFCEREENCQGFVSRCGLQRGCQK